MTQAELVWFNEPPSWKAEGNSITVTTAPKSDFWRKTHYGFIRDSGHFYYQRVQGDFTVDVKIIGKYRTLYDQAGLMVRLDDSTWVKTGIEFVDGSQYVSAVVTRDFSDWSIVPLPQNPLSIWLRLQRTKEAVEIKYSLDGTTFSMLRMLYLTPVESLEAGIMCASPGDSGFTATFEGLKILRAAS